jgi:glucosylceramidase
MGCTTETTKREGGRERMRTRGTKFLIVTGLLGFAAGSLSTFGCGKGGGADGISGTAARDGGSGDASTGSGGQAGTSMGGGGSGGPASSGGATGSGGTSAGTSGGSSAGTSGGAATGTGGSQTGGVQGTGGSQTGGVQGRGGAGQATGSGGSTTATSALVTSTNGTWTTTATWTETSSATVDVTVDDTSAAQSWEGFGGAFHERGWKQLSTKALQDEAMGLLFGADGARFALARIPIGASDYALERYTLDDTGTDVVPDSAESNRPPADTALSKFSIERDKQTLIPYVKAALAINPNLRFWAIPYTPPVWMKTGYKKGSGADPNGVAAKPSYFDGGTMKTDAFTLSAYAQYLIKFIQAYEAEGITVDTIAPQSEPTFDFNYPSCLWDKTNYTNFVGRYLGPALAQANLGTKIMLGSLSNEPADSNIMTAVMSDSAAMPYAAAIGVQWNVLSKVVDSPLPYGVPVWVTDHKCGNYPFYPSGRPATATTPAIGPYAEPPANDQSYGVETWWYIRDAITKAKVTAYNVPHMVLDTAGKGNDTTRQWAQDSLLTVSEGKLTKTQAYYVVRHFSQFVDPGAKVVRTNGGDAVAFKNPDGSLVAVIYSAAAKSNYVVAMGGAKLQFSVPAGGWATVKYRP